MWILALKGLTLHLLTMKTVMCYWKFTLLLLYYYVQLFPFFLLPAAVIFVIDSTNIERISEAHEELAKLMAEKRLKDALLLIFANKQVHVCLKKPFFFMIFSIVLQLQYYIQKRALVTHIRYIKILTQLEGFAKCRLFSQALCVAENFNSPNISRR